MKSLITKFLLSAVVPLGCVASFASPSLAATVNLTNAFTFGNQSFTQVYANDNGTLSFGNEYTASGPGTDFLSPAPSVLGIIAAGFGDYASGSGWGTSTLSNGIRFDFSGNDNVSALTNTFSVTLFNDSTFKFDWTNIAAPGSISVGLYKPGSASQEANPGTGTVAFGDLFFYDYSLNGADAVTTLNGVSLTTAVPEPSTLPGMIAFGSTALLLRLKRSSKTASK